MNNTSHWSLKQLECK